MRSGVSAVGAVSTDPSEHGALGNLLGTVDDLGVILPLQSSQSSQIKTSANPTISIF